MNVNSFDNVKTKRNWSCVCLWSKCTPAMTKHYLQGKKALLCNTALSKCTDSVCSHKFNSVIHFLSASAGALHHPHFDLNHISVTPSAQCKWCLSPGLDSVLVRLSSSLLVACTVYYHNYSQQHIVLWHKELLLITYFKPVYPRGVRMMGIRSCGTFRSRQTNRWWSIKWTLWWSTSCR